MAEVTDILFDETDDLACIVGDLVIGDATWQHQGDLLYAHEGEYKQSPTMGVGLSDFLNDEDPREMLRKIRIQFDRDDIAINTLAYNTELEINAAYK